MLAHQTDKAASWSKPVYLSLINVEALSENFEFLRYHTQDERTLTTMAYWCMCQDRRVYYDYD
jgi:hypothetical protein